jgi:hypothetical protein
MGNVKELLLLETDGSCAACGLRDLRFLTTHHIEQTKPKNEAYDNKIVICHNCHHALNNGKGLTPEDIRDIKRRLIIKTLTRPGLNALKEGYRRGLVIALPFLVNHLVEQGFLVLQEELEIWEEDDGSQATIKARYAITPEAMRLLDKWQLR